MSCKFLPLVFCCCTAVFAADQHRTWSSYGGGHDQSKFTTLDQITRENVDQLEVAWIYSAGDEQPYQFNPIVAHGVMYVLARNNSLVAVDLDTGGELWIHANLTGIHRRGINYWENADATDRRLVFTMENTLQEIDARTGRSILSFGDRGIVDLRQNLLRDPATIYRADSRTPGHIFENLVILGSFTGEGYLSAPGHIRAYNVVTGEFVWRFNTIPQPGEYGYDTWPPEAYRYVGGVNVWGEMSVDEKRGIVFLPLGSPTYDYYGADRIGSNLFGNCLVALDARTGKRLWHFQTVHHDLWDYDLTAAPQLITVNRNGERIDAVAVATKQGFLFVFNRVTGEPIFPIEEKPFPASDMPGEEAWPTQPIPALRSLRSSDPDGRRRHANPPHSGGTRGVAGPHRPRPQRALHAALHRGDDCGAGGSRRRQLGQYRRQPRQRHRLSAQPGLPVVLPAERTQRARPSR